MSYSIDYGQTWKPAGSIATGINGMLLWVFTAPAPSVYLYKLSFDGSPSFAPVSVTAFLIVQ